MLNRNKEQNLVDSILEKIEGWDPVPNNPTLTAGKERLEKEVDYAGLVGGRFNK